MVWRPTCVNNTASFFMKFSLVGGQISKAMAVLKRVTVRVERKTNEQRGGTHNIAAPITLYKHYFKISFTKLHTLFRFP